METAPSEASPSTGAHVSNALLGLLRLADPRDVVECQTDSHAGESRNRHSAQWGLSPAGSARFTDAIHKPK